MLILAAAVASAVPTQTPAAPEHLPAPDARVLLDDTIPAHERIDLARQWLQDADESSSRTLKAQLEPEGDPKARRIILEALYELPPAASQRYGHLLLELLATCDEKIIDLTATATGRIEDRDLRGELRRLAADETESIRRRRGAVLAIGHHLTIDAAASLMRLLTTVDAPALRRAVFRALQTVSGRLDLPDDDSWRTWWQAHSSLGSDAWYAAILRHEQAAARRMAQNQRQLEDRLDASLRRLYLAEPDGRREATLVEWLDDPVVVVQRLAMELITQRLVDVEVPQVGRKLREALRGHLDSPSPRLRRVAALTLAQLRDRKAALQVAGRLACHEEQDEQVMRASLKLLRNVPVPESAAPAIRLLEQGRLAAEAADVLAEILARADDGQTWLTPQQRGVVSERVRHRLGGAETVHPSMILLLARLAGKGERDHWHLIEGFLNDQTAAVKDAAARAWSESSQPLQPLVERADDPVIQPFLYEAASRRGSRPATLRTLATHKPSDTALEQSWQTAVIDMAARVEPIEALAAERTLASQTDSGPFREQLLLRAIKALETAAQRPRDGDPLDSPQSQAMAHYADLHLRRSQILLDSAKHTEALAAFDELTSAKLAHLNPHRSWLIAMGRVKALLALGKVDDALDAAHGVLSAPAADAPAASRRRTMAMLLLNEAQKMVDAAQAARAAAIVDSLGPALTAHGPEDLLERLRQLENRTRAPDASAAATDVPPAGSDSPTVKTP